MRTRARVTAFRIIFASRFGGVEDRLKSALYKKELLNANDIEYCEKILSLVKEHEREFSEILDKRSLAFPESRLFPADKSILFVALAEMLYFDDIPRAVSINEAANLASAYSTEKSASFVSGILSEVKKD